MLSLVLVLLLWAACLASSRSSSAPFGDDLCGIAALFNPAGFKSRERNLDAFLGSAKRQGLFLMVIELELQLENNDQKAAYDGAAGDGHGEIIEEERAVKQQKGPPTTTRFEADMVLRVRGTLVEHALWQKERLMNIAMEILPSRCGKIVWLDAEVFFANDDWVSLTSTALEKYSVVQPFRDVFRLTEGQTLQQGLKSLENEDIPTGLDKTEGKNRVPGLAASVVEAHSLGGERAVQRVLSQQRSHGFTGFAWAARRQVLELAGGLYDHAIIGGGDALMAHAFVGNFHVALVEAHSLGQLAGPPQVPYFYKDRFKSRSSRDNYHAWARKVWAATVKEASPKDSKVSFQFGSGVGFVPGTAMHLWHGDKVNRQYLSRFELLKEHGFHFGDHIELDNVTATLFSQCGAANRDCLNVQHVEVQLWKWTEATPESLRHAVLTYFQNRYEDGNVAENCKADL